MICQIALRLVVGISLMWCIMPRRLVTAGFFRIQMLVALGLTVLAAVTCPSQYVDHPGWMVRAPIVAAGIAAYLGSVLWTLVRRSSGGLACLLVSLLTGTALALHAIWSRESGDPPTWLILGNELASVLVLGSVIVTMLLGHWYLTAPMMSLDPLQRLNLYTGIAGVLRGALTISSWMMSGVALSGPQVIWLVLRVLGGILVPIAASLLIWRILRYRNTQSATGVAFAATILAFLGESASLLLSRDARWPL